VCLCACVMNVGYRHDRLVQGVAACSVSRAVLAGGVCDKLSRVFAGTPACNLRSIVYTTAFIVPCLLSHAQSCAAAGCSDCCVISFLQGYTMPPYALQSDITYGCGLLPGMRAQETNPCSQTAHRQPSCRACSLVRWRLL
jgi:hypothetical protein